jgi:hypothetical protein
MAGIAKRLQVLEQFTPDSGVIGVMDAVCGLLAAPLTTITRPLQYLPAE